MNQVRVHAPTPTLLSVEPILDERIQGVTLVNTDNLSAARRPTNLAEELTVFMTRVEVETVLRREKEKASSTTAYLNLKPSSPAEIVAKPYRLGYSVPKFQKFDG